MTDLDNRGNPYRVGKCKPGGYRKGRSCGQPCITISGENQQTSTPRSHTIHLTPDMARALIVKLQELIEAT